MRSGVDRSAVARGSTLSGIAVQVSVRVIELSPTPTMSFPMSAERTTRIRWFAGYPRGNSIWRVPVAEPAVWGRPVAWRVAPPVISTVTSS